jgi:hypothetical protein
MPSKFNIAAILIGFAAGAAHASVTVVTTPVPVATRAVTVQPAQTASVPATTGYAPSVQALMHAADSLRDSIHAMAREPASPERNQAIAQANRALLDTQVAMVNAYDHTAFGGDTHTLGAGSAHLAQDRTVVIDANGIHCTRLGTMTGCKL